MARMRIRELKQRARSGSVARRRYQRLKRSLPATVAAETRWATLERDDAAAALGTVVTFFESRGYSIERVLGEIRIAPLSLWARLRGVFV